MVGVTTRSAGPANPVAWEVFASGWALALWLGALSRGVATTPSRGVLSLLCGAVLLFPGNRWVVGALGVAYGAHFVIDDQGTAIIYAWVVVLASMAILVSLSSAARGDPAQWRARTLESLRPAGSMFAAVWLFSAGFCKLNTDFFTIAHSCGTALYFYQLQVFPYDLLPTADWAVWAAIALTPVAEIGGGILLLFGRTRRIGVLAAAGLLFLIGTNDIGRLYAFASPLLALMTLGFDWGPLSERVGRPARWIGRGLGAVALVSVVVAVLLGEKGRVAQWQHYGARAVFVVVVLSFLAAVVVRLAPVSLQLRRPRLAWVVPLFLLLHESSPYLGLPMSRNVAPAANLMVGPLYSNHFVVRHAPKLPFNRPVILVKSSDPFLNKAGRRAWITWALYDYLGRHPDVSVTYRVGERTVRVKRAGDDPRFRPSLIAKLFPVRPTLAFQGPIGCLHHPPSGPWAPKGAKIRHAARHGRGGHAH